MQSFYVNKLLYLNYKLNSKKYFAKKLSITNLVKPT